jgi:hypothetical protein
MTVAHIAVAKVVSSAVGYLIAAVVFVMDPSYKMFVIALLIAGTPPTITGIFNNRLQAKALRIQAENQAQNTEQLHAIKGQTDGIFAQMSAKADKAEARSDLQTVELKAATRRADNAEGRRDGVEAEQARHYDHGSEP